MVVRSTSHGFSTSLRYSCWHLLLKSFFEFTEVNLIPGLDNTYWHDATEAYVEGDYAQISSVMLVLAPTLWLAATYWLDQRRNRRLMVSPA